MDRKIIIAIDGHSSCGKSTLAQDLAKELNYSYIDTGAMYRAVTLYFLDHAIDFNDEIEIAQALESIRIEFHNNNGKNEILLNKREVSQAIRQMIINENVSEIAAIPSVRRFLVQQQQEMGKNKAIVMDGRDIGTVVFPFAELKIFLTAQLEIRAERRRKEYNESGFKLPLSEVEDNLRHRDQIDSTRLDSPLRQADDAIKIDNSELTRKEQFLLVLAYAEKLLGL